MHLSEAIIIVLISQVPLALFEIWKGIQRNRIEINKTKADEQSSLGNAVEGAGKTLVEAWQHIDQLECWKKDAIREIEQLREELEKWRNYAERLVKQVKRIDPKVVPEPFDPCAKVLRRDVNAEP